MRISELTKTFSPDIFLLDLLESNNHINGSAIVAEPVINNIDICSVGIFAKHPMRASEDPTINLNSYVL